MEEDVERSTIFARCRFSFLFLAFIFLAFILCGVFKGDTGPGKGKHVVLIAADDEYHSEEMLPQLANILSQRHGFTCDVLFSINP
jgi:hypothetical protein